MIIAISDTKKDNQAILEPLLSLPNEKRIVFTQIKTEERKSVAPQFLMTTAQAIMKDRKIPAKKTTFEIIEKPIAAMKQLRKEAGPEDVILATGSFFMVGEIRKLWYPEEWVLENRRSFK